MKNVTIALEEVARWARIQAAKQDASVSKLLGNVLKANMIQEQGYAIAMHKYLATPAKPLKETGQAYP